MVETFQDLDHEILGFLNEELTTYKSRKLVNILKGYRSVNKVNLGEWVQSDLCEPGFYHIFHADIISSHKTN